MKHTKRILATALLGCMLLALGACGAMPGKTEGAQQTRAQTSAPASAPSTAAEVYSVRFDLNGGTLVSGETTQQVEHGQPAKAPAVENGSMRLEWDKDFTSVTSDMVVTASWEAVELSATEIAEIVQASTVTVNCETSNGVGNSGSGFFIDSEGTIVTSYHVIEYATSIDIEMFGGGKYEVDSIVAFDELYDLAILSVKMEDTPGLAISARGVSVGEAVYANGSALGVLQGTFTSGSVSSTEREVNGISCIQMDAAISSGNSGGPLVNSYAEVVGINAMSYNAGENLNLAIKVENLDRLTNEVNYSVKNYQEWIMKESDRSYSPYADDGSFYYSTINTYSHVTERDCLYSVDFDGTVYAGYVDMCSYYVYEHHANEVDSYVDYLKTKGFDFYEREEFGDGVSYYYTNDWSGVVIDLFQADDGNLYLMAYC